MAELMIFDLQRFALHDGPGIRTTVFFKGCPLNCLWCHNPESKKKEPQLGFIEKNCTGCGCCQIVCSQGVHHITKDGKHEVDTEKCLHCGKCVEACFRHALKIYGKQETPESILQVVIKDRDFYRRSGGGLTVSGGEPMLQFEGLKKLLQLAKDQELHVCMETSGEASSENYLEIAPYVDIFLYDYKLTNSQLHKKYIGADNKLILENLELLCEQGSQIYLRCPIIPGINDNQEHYEAIAALSRKYEQIKQVHLMTYHDLAKGKAAQIGVPYALSDLKTITKEEKKEIYQAVEDCGCEKLQES